jgi:hypothetical protein
VRKLLIRGACAVSSLAVNAGVQQAAGFEFSVKNIMRGREPRRVPWSADSRWIYAGGRE